MTEGFDAIVVLGAAIRADGTPGPALIRRLDHGIEMFRQGRARALLLTGGAVVAGPAEAWLMADLARGAGVPDEALVIEDRSKSTLENARFSAAIMAERGWRRALLVSDGHHLPRALLAFRASGIAAAGSAVPGVFRAGPGAYARAALREVPACALYAARLLRERMGGKDAVAAGRR